MFDPIQNHFIKTANKIGIGKEFQAIQICRAAEKILSEILLEYTNEKVKAKSFKEGRLTIEVKSSGWSQEIIMRKDKIISEVNSRIGKKIVKDLRTRLSS